jgi:hypothetical protein
MVPALSGLEGFRQSWSGCYTGRARPPLRRASHSAGGGKALLVDRCLAATRARQTRAIGQPAIDPDHLSGHLYLDFETDLHDLGSRNPKIRGRKIGVEVHRGEQGFSPARHAGRLAAWDHHHPPEIARRRRSPWRAGSARAPPGPEIGLVAQASSW